MSSGLPPSVVIDSTIAQTTWDWFKKTWNWAMGLCFPAVSQTVAFTADLMHYIYPCDATTASFVATLPLASNSNGKRYVFKKTDASAHTITVTAAGSDLIDGVTTKVLSAQYGEVILVSDGISTWHVIAFSGGSGAVGAPAGSDTQVQYNQVGSFGASSDFTFNYGTQVARINRDLGIGVSPTLWNVTSGTLQVGSCLELASYTSIVGIIFLTNNLYFNTAWKYLLGGVAGTVYTTNAGADQSWLSAPVNGGGAGAAATLTELMRLDVTGKLGIGTFPPVYQLDVNGDVNTPVSKGYRVAGNVTFWANTTYTIIYSPGITTAQIAMGNATDAHTYYDNTGHQFRTLSGGANIVSIDNTIGLALQTAGTGIRIKEGSNARMGVTTLVLGVSVVSNNTITANTRIFLSVESLGTVTVPSAVAVTARSAGTSFTITASNLTDTSVVAWFLMEPA